MKQDGHLGMNEGLVGPQGIFQLEIVKGEKRRGILTDGLWWKASWVRGDLQDI